MGKTFPWEVMESCPLHAARGLRVAAPRITHGPPQTESWRATLRSMSPVVGPRTG